MTSTPAARSRSGESCGAIVAIACDTWPMTRPKSMVGSTGARPTVSAWRMRCASAPAAIRLAWYAAGPQAVAARSLAFDQRDARPGAGRDQ
jgi:hypothetical protein